MSPLTANLKHLYQCRMAMVMALFFTPLILSLPVLLHDTGREKAMPMGLAIVYCASFSSIISRLVGDTLGKPFSFCLPDHEKTVHKMLLLIWMVMVVSFLLVTAGFISVTRLFTPGLLFGILALLSLSYWIGTASLIRAWRPIFFTFLLAAFLSIHNRFLESVLTGHSWLVGTFCSMACIFIYGDLVRRRKGRALCHSPWPMFVHAGKGRKIDFIPKQKTESKPPSRIFTFLGPLLLARMHSKSASELGTGLWGQAYLLLGTFLNHRGMIILLPILVPLLLNTFMQSEISARPVMSTIVSVLTGVIGGAVCTIHRFEHITLLRRRVVFIRSITATLASTLVLIGLLALAIFLNNLLSSLLPGIDILGKTFQVAPVSWISLAFTVLLVPLFGGIMVFFKHYLPRAIVLCLTVVAAMIFSIVSIVAMENSQSGTILAGVVTAAAITWGGLIGVLYFDSMKRSFC